MAGDQLDRVVESEVYKYRAPEELSPQLLDAIGTIDSNDIIHKLLLLESDELEALFAFPISDLASIAESATESDLKWLAAHSMQIEPAEAQRVGRALADGSLTVPVLRHPTEDETTAVAVVADSVSPAAKSEVEAPVVVVRPAPYGNGLAAAAVVLLLVLLAVAYSLSRRKKSPANTE
jgi:hypothetical protein